jgi:hypothetical protein
VNSCGRGLGVIGGFHVSFVCFVCCSLVVLVVITNSASILKQNVDHVLLKFHRQSIGGNHSPLEEIFEVVHIFFIL